MALEDDANQTVPLARNSIGRTVQSVERAFDILELLASAEREMQLREITNATGLNTSTCHHLVSTLVKRGYVGQNPRGRTYFISSKVLELSTSRLRQFDLKDVAMAETPRSEAARWPLSPEHAGLRQCGPDE